MKPSHTDVESLELYGHPNLPWPTTTEAAREQTPAPMERGRIFQSDLDPIEIKLVKIRQRRCPLGEWFQQRLTGGRTGVGGESLRPSTSTLNHLAVYPSRARMRDI